MSSSPRPMAVRFDDDALGVDPEHDRTLGIAPAWSPRLLHGSVAAREAVELSPYGVHWDELDEDISIEELLASRGDMASTARRAA